MHVLVKNYLITGPIPLLRTGVSHRDILTSGAVCLFDWAHHWVVDPASQVFPCPGRSSSKCADVRTGADR